MNFQMNMAANANRAWRCSVGPTDPVQAPTNYKKEATIFSFTDSTLLFQFLTPHPSDMLEPRNVVPYYELPIYRTTSLNTIPARANYGQITAGVFNEPASVHLDSSNIQLSGIPDKLIIFVRKSIANMTPIDADCYATINKISINFNNQAGIAEFHDAAAVV